MTARVSAGLRAVQAIAARPDPTQPMLAGMIAKAIDMPLSSVSRLCAELVEIGFLERGAAYGSYRIGRAALALSGAAQAPYMQTVRTALTRIAQQTGETAFLAARTEGGMRVTAAVVSPWTLYSPAVVGEFVDDPGSAVVRAATGFAGGVGARGGLVVEAAVGKSVEVAVPILEPAGGTVAVVAVRLPVNRAKQGIPVARRAVAAARRTIEQTMNVRTAAEAPPEATAAETPGGSASALEAAAAVLRVLARSAATPTELARVTGLRRDRLLRIVDSCRRAGLVSEDADGGQLRLEWAVHGWLRASTAHTLRERGTPVVARAADETGACAFITVLRGMRSVTLVEELRSQGAGLEMTPWLGRPCPIDSADGGPTLVMDFADEDIPAFLSTRADPREIAAFVARVGAVTRDGVTAKESYEEAGQLAISAPVRDASGSVVAAACLVGATDVLKPRTAQLEEVARRMADELSGLLGSARLIAA